MLFKIKALFYALAVLWIMAPFDAYAVPAAPILHTLTQPDGTTLTARQWGDEWSHGWEDPDGYTIVQDKQTKHWKYAVTDINGKLISSSRIAGRDLPPSGISKKLRPVRQALETILSIKQSAALPQKVVSPTGTAYIPVFLVNFSNTTTTYTPANFNTLLFGTSNWSMKDYYEEVSSYRDFSVSAGPEGVTGWYTASNTHDYYGKDADGEGDDTWPGNLVYETIVLADASGFDFAPYDMDHDCYVDVVNIVHQGTGQEASPSSTDIWSHSWSLEAASSWGRSQHGEFETNSPCQSGGNIYVNKYVIQPEILFGGQQTIGVFAHEYGHALDLPDLYDTDGSSNGVGDWSLMDSGSWNWITKPGDRPAHLDAWSKYFLDWIIPNEVSGILTNEPIYQVEGNHDVVYKLLAGTALSGEYFLVENRQKVGFDSALPGSGLLIWHIDGNKINSNLDLNTVNNYECYPGGPSCAVDNYGVKLMQADNLWELEKSLNYGNAGDVFKSPANTTFNSTSLPNSNLYNGSNSAVRVTNISASGNPMTATFDTTQPFAGIATTFPAEGEEYSSCSYYSPPTFQWKTDEAFNKIEVQFSSDNFASKFTKVKAVIGINEISLSKSWKKILLMPGTSGGTVYWRVAGIKADKSMVYSNTSSFTVEALEPVSNMDISPASRSSLPTISWEINCAISFKVWFANDSDFLNKSTTMKRLSFKILNPNDNGGVFSLDLLSKEWDNIRSVVGDTSGSTIYWYVESWNKIKGYAKTSIESFVLAP